MNTYTALSESRRPARSIFLGLTITAFFGLSAQLEAQTWMNGGGTGNWADNGNWSSSAYADSIGATPEIIQNISVPQTVTLDRRVDLNRLTIGDSAAPFSGYTVSGASGGILNFQRSISNVDPGIISQNGANAISANVRADLSRLTITNTGSGSLALTAISRKDGGIFRFADANTTVAPGGGLVSTNGIANVFSTFNGTDWATYDSVTGAVGKFTGYIPFATATVASNASFTGNASMTASKTINSLKFASTTGSQTFNLNANDLTITSGGILRAAGSHNYSINGTGAIRTATGTELVIHNASSNALTINSRVATDGMTIDSLNRIIFTNANNVYGTGPINVVRGFAQFTNATDFANDINLNATGLGSGTSSSLTLDNSGTTRFKGNFQLNGTIDALGVNTPSVIFGAGKTLGGIGESRVNSTVLGMVDPGGDDRNGTLSFSKDLIFASGSELILDVGGKNISYNGITYDRVSQTGSGGSVQIAAGVELDIRLQNGAQLDPLETYFLLTRADAGVYGSYFTGKGEGATFQVGDFLTDITYLANWTGSKATSTLSGGNDIALFNIRAIPEPSAALLCGLGLIGLGLRRRR